MENYPESEKLNQDGAYQLAANLLINERKSTGETVEILTQSGLDHMAANEVVDTLDAQIRKAKIERANKDMLYGALWCIGGIIATVAEIGYIFWGAIVFGAIQFFRGMSNASGN